MEFLAEALLQGSGFGEVVRRDADRADAAAPPVQVAVNGAMTIVLVGEASCCGSYTPISAWLPMTSSVNTRSSAGATSNTAL
ncbi:hypothetical protein ACQPZF_10770 [Actinosynnema sp. CS-041913]|uniref:hypothetical protein n=1 Tax=Actinosynnema sp. CS-041913 TaxID=3239917 RepID=UPI003D8D7129